MNIRTAWTEEGHVEAALYPPHSYVRVVIDPRDSQVVHATCHKDSEIYRRLWHAAREAYANR